MLTVASIPSWGQIEIVREIANLRRTGAKLAAIASHLTNFGVRTRRGGR